MSQAAVSEACECGGDLCPTCSLCVECVPGHYDGYGGELYGLIGMLGSLMEDHECNPSPHHAAITALLEQADSALRSVEHIMDHRRA